MYLLIDRQNRHQDQEDFSHLMHEMFRLRARKFVHGKNWGLSENNYGEERDQLDELGEIMYVLSIDGKRRVQGALRVVPTEGLTLHQAIFKEPYAKGFCGPQVWECSRVCVDDDFMSEEGSQAFRELTDGLLSVIGRKYIETFLGDLEAPVYRRYRQIGLNPVIIQEYEPPSGKVYSVLVQAQAFHKASSFLALMARRRCSS